MVVWTEGVFDARQSVLRHVCQWSGNKGLLVARFVGRDRDPDMWESVLVEDGDPNAWVDFGENDVLL